MYYKSYSTAILVIVLMIVLQILPQSIAFAESTLPSHGLRFVACPARDVLNNMVTASDDGRVLVFWENRTLIKCFEEFLEATKGHELNVSVIAKNQYYRSLLAENIRQLINNYKNSAIMSDINRYGFRIFKVEVYKGNIVGVVIETSKPGGLGDEFAGIVARAVARTLGINDGTVVVMYTAPDALHMLEQLARNLNSTIEQLVKNGATIAIGSIGYLPAVTVDSTAVNLVGGVESLANMVAKNLPENGWVLLIIREKPLQFYPQPGSLTSPSTDATPSATIAGGTASATSTTPKTKIESNKIVETETIAKTEHKQASTSLSVAASTSQTGVQQTSTLESIASTQNNGSHKSLLLAAALVIVAIAIAILLLLRR
ncbi:hypothetical protein [Pyrofollis japonicus]|uniref:hypothetical protein n=1 Tax=Pyrofollis japonicus TaxID=3060460 RepID=UPI00295BAF5D|nr:hypothetical protein [Pyrofollis japonicus]